MQTLQCNLKRALISKPSFLQNHMSNFDNEKPKQLNKSQTSEQVSM
jgi:hypothetical protein